MKRFLLKQDDLSISSFFFKFHLKIFNKLRDDTNTLDQVTKEEVQRNIDRALERYAHWAGRREPDIPPGRDSPEPQEAYTEDDNEEEQEEMEETEETRHEEL